jgi:hypothetical protein
MSPSESSFDAEGRAASPARASGLNPHSYSLPRGMGCNPQSLLALLPTALGDRLPPDICEGLTAQTTASRSAHIRPVSIRRWRLPTSHCLRPLPLRRLEPSQVSEAHVSAAPAAGSERFETGDPDVRFVGARPSHPDRKVDDVIQAAPVLRAAHRAFSRHALSLEQVAKLVGRHARHHSRKRGYLEP